MFRTRRPSRDTLMVLSSSCLALFMFAVVICLLRAIIDKSYAKGVTHERKRIYQAIEDGTLQLGPSRE